MNNTYEETKREVDEIIARIMHEFNKTINLLRSDKSIVMMRLLVIFSFAEIMSGIFNKFYNLRLDQRELMKKWFKEYCLTDKNEIYKNHLYIKKIDEKYLYDLRCSVMHAFALPEQKNNKKAIMFPNGSETADNIKEMDKKWVKAGFDPVFISPDSLTTLFLKGGMNLVKEVLNPEESASSSDFEGLKRVRREFYRRGMVAIPLD